MNPSSELPLVSIVTPSYNQAQFLEQTIQSVIGQNYPHLEYLVVDGASTDGSQEIIQKYSHRIDWWVSEADQGQAEAINKGLLRAKGDFVAWLNSDDIYLPEAISRAVSTFIQHPSAGLVYGDVLAIDENSQSTNQLRYDNWSLVDLMSFRVIGQPSVFMRRSVLEQAGFLDASYHYLLDHQLWLRMAQISEICYIPGNLSAARFHPESKNVFRAAEFGSEAYRILDWMKTQPNLEPILKKNGKRIQAGAHRLSAFYLLDGGDASGSLREYRSSFFLHPGIVLQDWKHVLFAFASLLGFDRLGTMYKRLRRKIIFKS
jgi:glycosyltransferase involved in cell wall biosynthesis